MNNLASARISVPPLLVLAGDYSEEDDKRFKYVWRADLIATEPFWEGEFQAVLGSSLLVETDLLSNARMVHGVVKQILVLQNCEATRFSRT